MTADLSDAAQIERLNRYLPTDALLVSSDLIRSIATADVLGDGRARLPHAPDIREINFGDWDGMGFEDVAARDPVLSREYWENPGDVAAPNGESWNQAAARVDRFVADVNAKHDGRDIIAVAHFGVILTRVQQAAGITAQQALGHAIGNFSVTRLIWDGIWDVGEIGHLLAD